MTEPVLAIHNATVSRGNRTLISNLTGQLKPGEMTAVVGENGCGKSTLLFHLTGIRNHDLPVTLHNKPLSAWSPSAMAKQRAVMQQHPNTPFAYMTDEILLLGRSLYKEPLTLRTAWVATVAEWFALTHLLGRDIQSLSGGERQRIFLAKAVLQLIPEHQPLNITPDFHGKLLLLDEPTSALDLRHQRGVMEQLSLLAKRGLSVLCISHDINLVSPYCQQMWVLGEGICIAQGTPQQVLTEPVLTRCYRTPIELIERPGKPPLVTH
ncbi:ATP-binding cassette domain-containing protein [Aestuariibacter sp. GS-14]|uniref:ATP-binding cassette domain-containing protein n=1 Tax=Aestuariibacter sp. GS-14 TaxID=2590670 RepID=UPI0011293E5B|nr:ATP-binding cassette domain-containing protein [Aestuariibacter sp. GS-14]TPV57817.1 ATP-binding cassette domain-containing protein [Aestuariibacter sp. GS-14]